MGRDARQEALKNLLEQAERQGYITFDNIMDCADAHSLPIQDFDWLTSTISTRGIIVYDEAPTKRTVSDQDDDDFDDYAQSDYEAVYSRIIEMDESLKDFVDGVRSIVPPQWREFSTLKYQVQEGNQHARERMIEMHLRIALRIALQRAESYDMEIQDAVSEACLGLITAVDKYDPDSNGPFGSYASMWVLQNITRRQPTRRALMYYPVHKKEVFFSVYPVLKDCGYIEDPDSMEVEEVRNLLRDKLSLTDEQVDEAILMCTPFESFEELYSEFFNDYELEYNDDIEDWIVPKELIKEENIELAISERMLKEHIDEVLSTLTDREKRVISLRYGLDDGREKTLEEVGMEFGVTRERIRQIEAKALRKLRHPARSRKLKDFIDLSPSEMNSQEES
ncbi:MAG: sigma-70 family RNA polymerase sigma factor [Lachnospiraceae bacterium]|nr:sigma-70 family RNA polymerase sigma factor [Lachnospiraceae bacterium]